MAKENVPIEGNQNAKFSVAPDYPAWTKIIKLDDELLLKDFSLHSQFIHVANVIANTSPTRQTVIEFAPTIEKSVWRRESEWIYIFTVNGHIVKIGGTRTGLAGRCGSYLCGHHITERGKSRDCSKTNGFIYNTFDYYIRNGASIEMWAFEIPAVEVAVSVWGDEKTIRAQVYTAYETGALDTYARESGHYPCLSDNSDPSHRTEAKKSVKKK